MATGIRAALAVFLLSALALNSYAGDHDRELCAGNFTNLHQWPVVQVPTRVLLIPLIHRKAGTNENERWPERPAAMLADFYRKQFGAKVVWLRNIRSWNDYYREVDRLTPQQASVFDRVILIGHGGFDGPILKETEVLKKLTIKDSEANVIYTSESQPGQLDVFSLTYDVSKNKVFSDYVANNWRALTEMDPDEAAQRLDEVKRRSQPLDTACYRRYCAELSSAPAQDAEERRVRMHTCEDICRGPLFLLKIDHTIEPERFYLFAEHLSSLAKPKGLVFFGSCNPGSKAPEDDSEWNYPGFLTESKALGGPYRTYVHMFADASKRVSAGPIGNSSADDIVERIKRLETRGHQHNLCIAGPAS